MTSFVDNAERNFPFRLESAKTVNKSSEALVELMQRAFMSPEPNERFSLHEKTINLPFYLRLLKFKNITQRELLQHFVNNSAIFEKLETLIKTKRIFKEIITKDIFRHSPIEQDIIFFMRQFSLKRPQMTNETQNFLNFIEHIESKNIALLLAIFYVQYSGLFLGRAVYNATVHHLKKWIRDWAELPLENRGVSYWNFAGFNSFEKLKSRNLALIEAINAKGELLNLNSELGEIAKKAFEYNYQCIQSISIAPYTYEGIVIQQQTYSIKEWAGRFFMLAGLLYALSYIIKEV